MRPIAGLAVLAASLLCAPAVFAAVAQDDGAFVVANVPPPEEEPAPAPAAQPPADPNAPVTNDAPPAPAEGAPPEATQEPPPLAAAEAAAPPADQAPSSSPEVGGMSMGLVLGIGAILALAAIGGVMWLRRA